MTKPRALDLFCCGGGVSMGLHHAGFDVVGIDIEPQPHYPFSFIQADAMNPPVDLADFDFLWGSPPCQRYSRVTPPECKENHPDLIGPVREMFLSSGKLWCIENVPEAPVRPDLVLDGTMFPNLKVVRRRHFELNFPVAMRLGFPTRNLIGEHGWSCVLTKGGMPTAGRKARIRHGRKTTDDIDTARQAMGVDWPLPWSRLGEAIPPAYSEYIGRAALGYLGRAAA